MDRLYSALSGDWPGGLRVTFNEERRRIYFYDELPHDGTRNVRDDALDADRNIALHCPGGGGYLAPRALAE